MKDKLCYKKETFVLILIAVVLLSGIGFLADGYAKTNLIETFKELDQKDLALQGSKISTVNIKTKAGEIYCGKQLEKALAYFEELQAKGLCLKLDSAKYGNIKVLKHKGNSAVLLVESQYSGKYVTVDNKNEALRKMALNMVCQVELARDGSDWKIADLVVLKEE